ncbi:ester cyclase [Actinokineospora sp.]|uniref:ester cyclase n=1 Tax=Actinokineospora sp. TaxID=1872133 RepID=UPI004037D7FE
MSAATTSEQQIGDLASAYGQAWNDHDVAAILALQSDDMVFHLHIEGFDAVQGSAALRELFGFFFTTMPDYRADITRTHVRDGLVVLEYDITATLAEPFPLGAEVGLPTGEPMTFAAVDVLQCAEGRFTRKDTYVDGFALRRGVGLAP